jgi:IclR family pca regulon transcriptional regulator
MPSHRASPGSAPAPGRDLARFAGDPDFMTSLARGLTVIRAFSGGTGRRTIGTLAQATGLSRAAVRRCLHTLRMLGYVGLDEHGHYALRPQVLALGYAFLSSSSLVAAARPLLEQVSAAVRESCSMAVLEGDAIVYVARSAAAPRIMTIDLGVGSRLPAYCTSMGRVLLAGLPRADLDAYLARLVPAAHTPRTVTERDALARLLADVARDGYALVDQELEMGLRSIAVPVRDLAGNVVAALNVSTHASRVGATELRSRCLHALRGAAQELAMMLPA